MVSKSLHIVPFSSQTYRVQLFLTFNGIVKTEETDVLFTGTLLRLDKTGSTVHTDNKTASNLGIKSTAVTSFLNSQDTAHPGDDFVRGGIGGLA